MLKVLVFVYILLSLVMGESVTNDSEIDYDVGSETNPLSITCMRCLCKVMACKKDEGCVDNVCGVFHISQSYWEATNNLRSDPANTKAYQKCSNNVWCAARTVQRHMKHFLPACEAKRPDRFLCENAVALHKFGPRRCHHDLTLAIERKLYRCMDEKVWRWLEDEAQK